MSNIIGRLDLNRTLRRIREEIDEDAIAELRDSSRSLIARVLEARGFEVKVHPEEGGWIETTRSTIQWDEGEKGWYSRTKEGVDNPIDSADDLPS